jgi:Zn finger protein HypA/HybF involved in hydrogenase expression
MSTTEPTPVAAQSESYACPKCSGKMNFDAAKGQLLCPFCGHTMAVPATQQQVAIAEHDLEAALKDASGKALGYGTLLKSIKCQSCGAVLNVEPNITSTKCSFCGSNQVLEQQVDPNLYQPESLAPFAVDDARANNLFRDWLGRGLFTPNDLKRTGGGQKLRGVYLPFWTFDAHAESDWRAESGDYYYETQWVTVTRDGKQVQEQQQVQKTRWYWTNGHHRGDYDDVLVYATRSIPTKILQKVYPYDTKQLVPYQPQYLSGWSAESYQVPLAEAWPIGRDIITQHERSACDSEVPGDTHRNLNVSTLLSALTFKHVLLPVWVASYRYHDKTFRFMINGQTGRVEGEKPVSWIKVTIAVVLAVVIVGLLIYLYSRSQANQTGELLMLKEWAMLQLNAPALNVPLLV